jgi:hypothetical protein
LKWSDLKYVIWHQGGPIYRGEDIKPEEIVAKLKQVDVLVSQGVPPMVLAQIAAKRAVALPRANANVAISY